MDYGGESLLVIGGYGVVGPRLVRRLAELHPGRVVIAGRRLEPAVALARELGGGLGTRHVDVEDPGSVCEGLRDVSVVVCCVEQREDLVLREAVHRGLAYADLAPKLAFRTNLDALDAEAKRSGARLAMGIGVCPGISSVMARALCDRLNGPPDEIETALLYGMGDQFGADSLGFITRSATLRFEVALGGARQRVVPWTRGASVDFPPPFGRRTAYLHPFSDAVMFPRTLGARTSIARLAIDPPWIGALAVAASRLRLLATLAPRVRGSGWLRARLARHDGFALVVRARRGGTQAQMSLQGHHQAQATAIAAAELVDRLIRGEPHAPGLWMPEQYVAPAGFFARLRAEGVHVVEDAPT